jgi:hypothetical protein
LSSMPHGAVRGIDAVHASFSRSRLGLIPRGRKDKLPFWFRFLFALHFLALLITGNMSTSGPSPYYGCILHLNRAAGYGFSAHLHLIAEQIGCPAYHEAGASPSGIAGAMGGFLAGRPRHARIFWIASGGLMAQRILIRPPQRGQARTSNSNTRDIRVAHG